MSERPGENAYHGSRSETPNRFAKWWNRYRFAPEELQTLNQYNDSLYYSELLDLSVAQAITAPKEIVIAGRAIVIYGTSSAYDPMANTGLEVVASDIVVGCFFNDEPLPSASRQVFPLKHNRGFRGDFRKVRLTWPAQSGKFARLYILKFDEQPWQSGESAT